MIVVVDFGAGNLHSVRYALNAVGAAHLVSADPEKILSAGKIIFPGVGAAGLAMAGLKKNGLDDALRAAFSKGIPMFGICIGMQLLFDHSEEDGGTDCLKIVPGRVKRFVFPETAGLKVPQMGWNSVDFCLDHPVFASIPSGTNFYFVHSYYPSPSETSAVAARTSYGPLTFASAVSAGNLVAVQFHPEANPGPKDPENFFDRFMEVVSDA